MGSDISQHARAALERIARREPAVGAWTHVDEGAATAPRPDGGALAGLTLGVKDIIDVAGMPCEFGTPIHRGRVPLRDAALVAELRGLGAAILGKTVTTELAFLSPSATRNPHDPARSPGGSSSGSAAAVADGHVDAALGTQTAGSLLRPASFCGVVGFKPTHGRFSLSGVKSCAPSLDTIGWLSKDVATARRVFEALTTSGSAPPSASVAFARTAHWPRTEPGMRTAFEKLAAAMGWREVDGPPAALDDMHLAIMRFEMSRELAMERLQFPQMLSAAMTDFIDPAAVPHSAYVEASKARDGFDAEAVFGGADILATPAAPGEAPLFGSTGDAAYNRFPTLLGLPAMSIPFAKGENGLPLGVQLIARRNHEALLLATAEAVERAIASA